MITVDLHGMRLKEAEELFFQYLTASRLENRLYEVCFVTGQGVIRESFIKLAKAADLSIHALDPGRLWIFFE